MYFTQYHPLKERLRDRSITDREALPYLVMFCMLEVVGVLMPFWEQPNKWDFVSTFFGLLITFGGVIFAYRCNGGKDGYDFIQKFVILGWVVTFRFILLVIPLFLAVYDLGILGDTTGPIDVIILALIEIMLYYRIGRHIADTNGQSSEQVSPPDRQ